MKIRKNKLFILLSLLVILALVACGNSENGNGNLDGKEDGINDGDVFVDGDKDLDDGELIQIKDEVLRKVIIEELGKDSDEITRKDMESLRSIFIMGDDNPVKDLSGLEHATKLGSFSAFNIHVKSLAPLAGFDSLYYLSISEGSVEEAIPTFNSPSLKTLTLSDFGIENISFLKDCPLEKLILRGNEISSIEVLRDMNLLEDLDLQDNRISDLSPLGGLGKLSRLVLQGNEIEDIGPLEALITLEHLNISYNYIDSLAPIVNLPRLEELRIYEDVDKYLQDKGPIEALKDRGVEVFHNE